jgi:hypothetical protein
VTAGAVDATVAAASVPPVVVSTFVVSLADDSPPPDPTTLHATKPMPTRASTTAILGNHFCEASERGAMTETGATATCGVCDVAAGYTGELAGEAPAGGASAVPPWLAELATPGTLEIRPGDTDSCGSAERNTVRSVSGERIGVPQAGHIHAPWISCAWH